MYEKKTQISSMVASIAFLRAIVKRLRLTSTKNLTAHVDLADEIIGHANAIITSAQELKMDCQHRFIEDNKNKKSS